MNFLRIFLYITDTPLHSLDFLSVLHQQHSVCMIAGYCCPVKEVMF